jgi:hypothetical protein
MYIGLAFELVLYFAPVLLRLHQIPFFYNTFRSGSLTLSSSPEPLFLSFRIPPARLLPCLLHFLTRPFFYFIVYLLLTVVSYHSRLGRRPRPGPRYPHLVI